MQLRGIALCLLASVAWGAMVGCGKVAANCAADQMACGGAGCVDVLTSNTNCGTCGNACGSDQVCGNGTCGSSCPANQTECNMMCSDTSTDAQNCGACGSACDPGDVCVGGACQIPCDTAKLMSPVTDPWGLEWDGLERTALALDVATADCQAFGARIPTATELFRVAANQSGAVGQSFNTNYLWSEAPDDHLNQAVVRLSDGGTSSQPALTPLTYRCVCPTVLPKSFSGHHCYGTPGSDCFAQGSYNVDAKDRPALRKSAAVWECINDRAHLADITILAEAIRNGLPGSNAFLMTADMAYYSGSTQLRWNTATWTPTGNLNFVDLRTAAPFRCAAPNSVVSPNPNTIANGFIPKTGSYVGETVDQTGAAWAAAHDACYALGGHLPRATELAELILEGLPGGSNASLWTSDQDGYNGTQFLAEIMNWSGLDQRFSYAYGASDSTATWAYKTTASEPFRCVYYPIDAAYTAPADASCMGGCFALTLTGATAPKLWFDRADRAASTLTDAFKACAAIGGHVPSERDFTEAIRAGLPGGSGAYLYTSDFGQGAVTGGAVNTTVVNWTGTAPAFTDQYSTYMTWSDQATARPFRCMWTNELR